MAFRRKLCIKQVGMVANPACRDQLKERLVRYTLALWVNVVVWDRKLRYGNVML